MSSAPTTSAESTDSQAPQYDTSAALPHVGDRRADPVGQSPTHSGGSAELFQATSDYHRERAKREQG